MTLICCRWRKCSRSVFCFNNPKINCTRYNLHCLVLFKCTTFVIYVAAETRGDCAKKLPSHAFTCSGHSSCVLSVDFKRFDNPLPSLGFFSLLQFSTLNYFFLTWLQSTFLINPPSIKVLILEYLIVVLCSFISRFIAKSNSLTRSIFPIGLVITLK